MNILVNLPPEFFKVDRFVPIFERLEKIGMVKKTSYNEEQEIIEDLAWADAVIMWSWPIFDVTMINNADGFKFLGQINTSQTTAKACLDLNIPHSLNQQGWSNSVAEMALGLTLNGLRRISVFHEEMRSGKEQWGGLWPEGVDHRERLVEEVTVGLIGFGGVGQRLRQLLKPFGCHVKIVDPYLPQEIADSANVTRVEKEELFKTCDVVILCATANSDTSHLVGSEELSVMKDDALLINVARASLVDTDALVHALQTQALHACLDVFDVEPLEADHPLRTLPNAHLTPHRAGGVYASGVRVLNGLIDDLIATLNQEAPMHQFKKNMLARIDA